MKKIELPYITLADLCSRLALLLHSGVNIDTGLSIIAEEENDPEYVKILLELSQSMEEGVSFADALESSGCFSSHIISMIRSTNTAVFPLPAAADTNIFLSLKSMTFCWSSVHVTPIEISPVFYRMIPLVKIRRFLCMHNSHRLSSVHWHKDSPEFSLP